MPFAQPPVAVVRPHRRRSWGMAAVCAVGVALAAVGCRALDVGPAEPPSAVVDPAQAAAREVRGLAGVAAVHVQYALVGVAPSNDRLPAHDPASWRMTLTVVMAERSGPQQFAALGRDVAGVVGRDPAAFTRNVWLRDSPKGVVPSTAVQVLPAPDVDHAVESAFAISAAAGVLTVDVGVDASRVSVLRAADIPAAAAAASAGGIGLTSVSTIDGRARAQAVGGGLDERRLDLVAEAASWPSVVRVRFSFDPGTVKEALEVQVDAEAAVEGVAAQLHAAAQAKDIEKPIAFTVSAGTGKVSGYVGEPTYPETSASAASSPAPTPYTGVWPDDPAAPACTGDDLTVAIDYADAAMGTRYLALTATNASARACAVQARPELEFGGVSGATTPRVTFVPLSVLPAEPGRIVVPAGVAVRAQLRWGAMSIGHDSDPAATVRVRVIPGASQVVLPVDSWVMGDVARARARVPESLDILDGAQVQVSPWLRSLDQ